MNNVCLCVYSTSIRTEWVQPAATALQHWTLKNGKTRNITILPPKYCRYNANECQKYVLCLLAHPDAHAEKCTFGSLDFYLFRSKSFGTLSHTHPDDNEHKHTVTCWHARICSRQIPCNTVYLLFLCLCAWCVLVAVAFSGRLYFFSSSARYYNPFPVVWIPDFTIYFGATARDVEQREKE